ncbi:MAG TPA: phospholipid carrier-dependent glycosyltransferase [Chloroflexi bacterium]|nr:phospholipid carrier-dependent glycosyltransferase [Chloroflexota bacterium]
MKHAAATREVRYWLPPLILYLAASLLYNASFPVMEIPDEPYHYGYIEQLRRGEGFPDPTTAPDNLAEFESSQAPLYYMTAAAVLRLFPDLPAWGGVQELKLNRWFGAYPGGLDNKNIFLHNLDDPEQWFQGIGKGVRVARLVAMAYGLVSVLAAYLLAREVTTGVPWLPALAGALVAFNPRFIQIGAAVQNDTAAAAFVGLTLWRMARIVRRRPSARWEYALAGLFAGLAAISKSSALTTFPLLLFGLGLAWAADRKERSSASLTEWGKRAVALLGTAAVSGGWWYVLNAVLYGDPLRSSAYESYPLVYPGLRRLRDLLPDLPRSLFSYWADLGYGGDLSPGPLFYAGAWAIVALSLIGLIRWMWNHRPAAGGEEQPRRGLRSWALLLLIASEGVMAIAVYIRLQQTFNFAWGRLLLPGVAAFATLMAVGLYHLWPRRLIGQIAALFLMVYAFLIPALVLLPAYLPPRVSEVPPLLERLDWRYGEVVRLVGYDMESRVIVAGQERRVTLCWETLARPEIDYAFALHFVGPENRLVGARDSYHGLGRYPSSVWRTGDLFCDEVGVSVAPDLEPAQIYQIEISVYDPDTLVRLPVYDSSGAEAPPFAGWVKAPSHAEIPSTALPVDVVFGDKIALRGYAPGTGSLTLYWEALTAPQEDLTVFVHVVDGDGNIVAQDDSLPRQGRYPTRAWDAGEIIADEHPVSLPASASRIYVGLYRAATGERLPAMAGGQRLPNDAVELSPD